MCPDRPGLVAAISGFIYRHGGNILAADQHSDVESGRFYMRVVWDLGGFALDRAGTAAALDALGRDYAMEWDLRYSETQQRVAVLVSKTDIVGVISNHDDLRSVASHFDVPYVSVPMRAAARDRSESEMQAVLTEWRADLVVLARYMQVLSDKFVDRWQGRLINIHHSFLPAFVGARAYRQARERGVKMIGATAHYVTNELDKGPIIEQDVVRVSHQDTLSDFIRKGRELERIVLTRAVRLHLERRVVVSETGTVVFS
ncbi:MAG: formyltetrahydrofolate deformylase [Chloroflexi bacterium 13_1_40CM_3_70_6]|nr:MAG: formyltetrahydrofolate deformylase [Chloroflexi bacterium 13_1_40CM_3_70_6]